LFASYGQHDQDDDKHNEHAHAHTGEHPFQDTSAAMRFFAEQMAVRCGQCILMIEVQMKHEHSARMPPATVRMRIVHHVVFHVDENNILCKWARVCMHDQANALP
jgi:hypothetical protein